MKNIIAVLMACWILTGCSKGNDTVSPQSNFTYLQKIRDGVVFSEGFENDNFVIAEGWSVLQGVPANSSSQYFAGIKAFDCSANSQSLPVIKKVITDTAVDQYSSGNYGWMVSVWFYDDATKTNSATYPGPYIKLKMTNGNFVSCGVRNSVDTTHYCFTIVGGTGIDTPDTASSVVRTTGWHNFTYVINLSGTPSGAQFFIDNKPTGPNLFGTLIVSEIHVCSAAIGDSGSSFGFFDNVQYFRNAGINVSAVPLTSAKFYDQNYSFIANYSGNGFLPATNTPFSFISTFPFSGYMELTLNSVVFKSNLLSVNPGDIYKLNVFEFGQKFKPYNPQLDALNDMNQSTAGVQETIFNAYKNKYVLGIPMMEGFSYKQGIDEWYNFAVQGNPFSSQVEDNNVGFGVIDSNPAVGTSVVQIKPNLSANPTDTFTANRKYVLFNAANTRRQTMTLASKTTTKLTFNEVFEFPFSNLDYVADIVYHPFLELGSNPYGLQMLDERYIRFKFQQTVQDWNGG